MIRPLGSPKRLCLGPTRRDLLDLGGLTVFGVGLSDSLSIRGAQGTGLQAGNFGEARSCILPSKYRSPDSWTTSRS
jgi:hypothetical protein